MRDAGDDIVELIHVSALEADVVVGQLRGAGIDATIIGVSPFTGEGGPGLRFAEGSRIQVRRRDFGAARALLEELADEPISDEELAAQAEAAAGTEFDDGAVI